MVLARDDAFPDALAGVPLAAHFSGPLLLTTSNTLASETSAEIQRVLGRGATVYLLGGATALSPTIETQLHALGYATVRIAGADRYQTAVDIAYRTLGEICKAVGKLQITDSMELHNIAMECDVAVEDGQPYTKDGVQKEGKPQNVIKRYYRQGEAPAVGQQAAAKPAAQSAAAPAATKATPPWKR